MDFFAHQQKARAQTRFMLGLFVLSTLSVAAIVGLLVLALVGNSPDDVFLAAMAGLITLVLIAIASIYKTFRLSGGGGVVAREMGASLVNRDTQDPQFRKLLNVVDEMAIASGMAVPEVYVLRDDPSINAFAAGFSTADAAVCVTSGALQKLSRDELQGVIAHEFSHIMHGDMRLNIRLMGVVFGLFVLSIIGREILSSGRFARRGSSKDVGGVLLVGGVIFLLGYLGMLLGRMIQSAISRAREFDADASAVQFTRDNEGLAGALKKIGGLNDVSATGGAMEEVAHMCIAPGSRIAGLFATHPPIDERILRLDPGFQNHQLLRLQSAQERLLPGEEVPSAAVLLGIKPVSSANAFDKQSTASAAFVPRQVISQLANPRTAHVRYAAGMRAQFPAALLEAANSRTHAPYVLLALLCTDSNGGLVQSTTQSNPTLHLLSTKLAAHELAAINSLLPLCGALDRLHKLPLACMAFPSFKSLDLHERARFDKLMQSLINLDGLESVFEYSVLRAMQALDPRTDQDRRSDLKLSHCAKEISTVLALFAQYGHSEFTQAEAAYQIGAQTLQMQLPALTARTDLTQLDFALATLARLIPASKRQLVVALTAMLQSDSQIQVSEAELLRVICLSIHCPLPPLIDVTS
jgi:Zn-dependent protease with chaperone function